MALISNTPQFKYDVFLSFRGIDTRNTFTSHLREALRDKQIETFIDDTLNRGDEISPSLLSAIEGSHISIVIFSKKYASSGWCLEELVNIVECRENHEQIVIPVFYEIDPTDVRNQTGSYAEAFGQHEQRFMESLDKVQRIQRWKDALKKAANLSGFDSRVIKSDSKLVNIIVVDVLKKLDKMPPSYNTNLPGMNSRIKEIESLLRRGDVLSLGIWGIGGIGKTTLAEEVSKRISCQFESSGFAGSVRECSKQGRLNSLRQSLLSTLLKDENAYTGTCTEKRLGRKKLLIILDDVTDFTQIEKLIGDLDCLSLESRIIVTSRDKQVLQNCKVHHIYQVEELCFNDALKLFCQHAFRQNHPTVDYKELSNSVVKMVGSVPLACKVLGSALFGKTKNVWVSALEKLENNFDKKIHEVLKTSYDELDDDEQSLFLDIACFFKVGGIDLVKVIMDACGSSGEVGISNLIDKSLITKSGDKLMMHDLLQAMGKEIVRQLSKDPSKSIRLWRHKDIYDALTKDKGAKRIEAISLDMSSSNARDININPRAFKKAKKLRLLNFYVNNYGENCKNKVHVSDGLVEFNFTELKYLHWYGCPLKSFRLKYFEKLVILEMRESNIEELWSDIEQPLYDLKTIDLSWSQHLISCPDLSLVPNLESLTLGGCTSLESIPDCTCLESLKQLFLFYCSKLKRLPQLPTNLEDICLNYCTSLVEIQSSFTHLHKVRSLDLRHLYSLPHIPDLSGLKSLNKLSIYTCSKLKMLPELPTNLEDIRLDDCTSLVEIQSSFTHLHKVRSLFLISLYSLPHIPDLRDLKSLIHLSIYNCSKLKMLPELPNNIERLTLEDVPIEEFPPSSEDLDRLSSLSLINCSMLKSLPSSVRKWKSLHYFELKNCPKIDKLPDDIGALESLKLFTAEGTAIGEVPSSISCLKSLERLDMCGCEGVDGVGLLLPPNLLGLENLSTLKLIDCGITKLPDSLGDLTSLQRLVLDRNNFVSIPGSIINLSKLQSLRISYCKMLRELPQLPAGTSIYAVNCTSLETLSNFEFQNDIFERLSSQDANFVNCYKLDPDALNDVLYDTQRKIEGQADLVKKDTLLEIYDKQAVDSCYGIDWLPASIIYPGSKIPKWFENQSNGSFIEVELPSDCLNSNFLCYALCVVVAPNPNRQCNHPDVEDHRYSEVTFDCNVKSKDGNESNLFDYHRYPIKTRICLELPYCGPDYLKSNHVITCFGYYFFREFCDNEFSFQFNVENFNCVDEPINDKEQFRVEMCGVHLISHLHLEELDEEDEPHPNRLKHILPLS